MNSGSCESAESASPRTSLRHCAWGGRQSIDTARDSECRHSRRPTVTPLSVSDTAHDSALPPVRTDTRLDDARVPSRFRRAPAKTRMRSMTVEVPSEIEELHLQISGRPEQGMVQAFAPNGADQSFNEWM
jgi:hypothetical protein